MKRIILITALLFSMAQADDNWLSMKKQCQYQVYGSGKSNQADSSLMYGLVSGQLYQVPSSKRTSFAKEAMIIGIIERACKEAFNNNTTDNFLSKFQWGIAVTINKEDSHYRTVK